MLYNKKEYANKEGDRVKNRKPVLRALCLALAVLLGLAGCGASNEPELVYEDAHLPQNDGQPAKLTIGPIDGHSFDHWLQDDGEGLREALEEVIAKYQADFPNTEIKLVTQEDFNGNEDITVIDQGVGIPGDQWLLDLSEYEDAWGDAGRVCKAADTIMHYMGGEEIYAIPLEYAQLVLFYRADWFDEYNADKTTWPEKVSVENWGRFMRISERLEKGGVLIRDEDLPQLFQSILWTTTGTGGLADLAAACYASPKSGGGTVFTGEKAESAVSLYKAVLDRRADPGDDPLGAFIDGQAAVLICSPSSEDYARLSQMPEGSWAAACLPAGESGSTVVPFEWRAWAVRADTKEPEKAVHFLAYLTNPDNNTHMVKVGAASPVYRDFFDLEPSLWEEPRAGELDLVNQSCFYAELPQFITGANPYTPLRTYPAEYAAGRITGKELLDGLDRDYREMLDAYVQDGGVPPWERTEG